VCLTHHCQFDAGRFVIVPTIHHEHQDFALWEQILASGGLDPGRSFPSVSTCRTRVNEHAEACLFSMSSITYLSAMEHVAFTYTTPRKLTTILA